MYLFNVLDINIFSINWLNLDCVDLEQIKMAYISGHGEYARTDFNQQQNMYSTCIFYRAYSTMMCDRSHLHKRTKKVGLVTNLHKDSI